MVDDLEVHARIAELEAENAALREALRPFSNFDTRMLGSTTERRALTDADELRITCWVGTEAMGTYGTVAVIRVYDIRRARALLKATP